ncbi:MAG: hypothetical protein Q9181_004713 [Wetmoreana brouardii]
MASKQEVAHIVVLGLMGLCITQLVHQQLLAVRKACEITQAESINPGSNRKTEDEKNSFDEYKHSIVQSVIKCLSDLLPLSYQYEAARMNGQPSHRTQPESDAIKLLEFLLERHGARIGLECNLFSLWLARYPFGGDLESKHPSDRTAQTAAKQRVVENIRSYQDSDLAMTKILRLMMADEQACQMMSSCRLLVESCSSDGGDDENDDEDKYSRLWYEVHGTAPAPDPGLGPMMRRGQRVREESLEEQALRSRRREAMVLGEMGRPIERENIIQRLDTLASGIACMAV